MALPVPAHAIMTPLQQFPPNNPPFLPNVTTLPQLEQFKVMMASAIANESASKAQTNSLRIFAYNILSSNNWMNNAFADILQIAMDVMAFKLSTNSLSGSPQQDIYTVAEEACSLWSSNNVNMYPELRGMVPPQVLNAADQNSAYLADLKNKISAIYRSMGAPAPMPNAYGAPAVAYDPRMMRPAMPPTMNPAFGGYGMPISPGMGSNAGSNARDYTRQDNYMAGRDFRSEPRGNWRDNVEPTEDKRVKTVTKNDWSPSIDCPYRTMVDENLYNIQYIMGKNNNIIEIIERKGTEMDREAHRLTLIGGSVSINTSVSSTRFREDVRSLKNIDFGDIEEAHEGREEKTRKFLKVSEFVKPSRLVDAFRDDAIFCVLTNHSRNKAMVYREFATIITPIITKENYWYINETIAESTSFKDVVTAIEFLVDELKQITTEENEEIVEDKMFFIDRIDKFLTDVVNMFISCNMSIEGLSIDSFCGDVLDLPGHIGKKYGANFEVAFNNFEQDLLSSLFKSTSEEERNIVTSSLVDGYDDMHVSYIPATYSITSVNVHSKDLGITVGHEPLLIKDNMNPELYEIANSIFKQSTDYYPLINILMTKDGQRYFLYKGYIGIDAILIRKA